MPRPTRPKKGNRRVDAAIAHFAAMGYRSRDVQKVVDELLKAYGGTDAWPFLEDSSYLVVQEMLIEKQEQEEKQLLLQHQQEEEEEQQEPQQEEAAPDLAPPEDNMPIVEVHNVEAAEVEPTDEEVEDPMLIETPTLEAIAPVPAAKTGGTRRPCYGWISESDEDDEQHELQVPTSTGGGLLCKRK
ncbi:hypothetical protein ACP4OV_019115 [Aristida adscensionis]